MTEQTDGERTRVGPYLVQDVVGSGPHGIVYSILHEKKRRRLVLKRFHEPVRDRPGKTFNRIAQVVEALTHPTIVEVRHIHLHGEHIAIISDVVDGRSLAEVLNEEGALDPGDVVALAKQLCAGLQYAHQRCVYHTSFRPQNIFLMPDGGIRITDFAIAALYGQSVRERPRYTASQEAFFAPEFRDRGVIHPASDIYSLGVVLYVALTGGLPVDRSDDGLERFSYIEVEGTVASEDHTPTFDIARLPAGTPPSLRDVIVASVSPDPGERPGHANAVADVIRGERSAARLDRHARARAGDEAQATETRVPGPRVRVCDACRRPVSPAGRVCLGCGLVLHGTPDPTETIGYFHKHGRRLLARGEVEEAERAYRRGIERNPHAAALYNELGDVLAVQNRFDEAVKAYRRAVEFDPDDDDAWHDLGVSLAALNRGRQARKALERAVELTERDEVRLSALLHLGTIAADAGDIDGAIDLWQSVLEEEPGLIPVRMALASTWAGAGACEEAIEQLQSVLSIEPELREAHNLLARVRERSQTEREDADTSFGLIDDSGGGRTYLGPGFRWMKFR